MYDQEPFAYRLEWSAPGAVQAAARGDIVIMVDVRSCSSTVVTALAYGAFIYPYTQHTHAAQYAEELGAELAVGRAEAAQHGGHSLSPRSFGPPDAGKRYVLCSANGATYAQL